MTRKGERFEIDIRATPSEVWERLTTAAGLASWFGARASADLRVGGDRVVGWGDEVEIVGEFREIDPETRLRVVYLAGEEEVGAEEWLIETDGTTTRLTLINSMPDEGIDDWEGFYGDVRRGWNLFLASLRFALEDAITPDRVVDCEYHPAVGSREEIWARLEHALDRSSVITGCREELVDPPHSRLLTRPDRTLLLDIEGSGDEQVLFAQVATHHGPTRWRGDALELVRWAMAG